jgi:hypothetical protein
MDDKNCPFCGREPLAWTEKQPTTPGMYLIDEKGFGWRLEEYDEFMLEIFKTEVIPGRRYLGPIPSATIRNP